MKLFRYVTTTSLLISVSAFSLATHAATATSNLTVSASVANNCSISTGTVNFSSYDPVTTNATTDLKVTAASAFTVACTKGAVTTIGADAGANSASASGTTRALKSGVNILNYDLYVDSGYTNIWKTSGASNLINYTSAGKSTAAITIYGKVPAGQDVPAGSYTDTVNMTLNF